MRRSEMNRVRASILGKREIEELRQIPDNLRLAEPKTKGGREIRKVVKKRQNSQESYQIQFPKTGDPYIDKESESDSLSKGNPKKDRNYRPPKKK